MAEEFEVNHVKHSSSANNLLVILSTASIRKHDGCKFTVEPSLYFHRTSKVTSPLRSHLTSPMGDGNMERLHYTFLYGNHANSMIEQLMLIHTRLF